MCFCEYARVQLSLRLSPAQVSANSQFLQMHRYLEFSRTVPLTGVAQPDEFDVQSAFGSACADLR